MVIEDKKNILVVEDDPVSFKLVHELIQPYANRITRSSNGEEALHYIRENGNYLNLVIMDILLPKIDGIKLTKIVRESHPFLPIIGISASTQVNGNNECIKAGCNAFYQKPIDIGHFEKTIDTFLQWNPQTT